jgi:hypothetical protein
MFLSVACYSLALASPADQSMSPYLGYRYIVDAYMIVVTLDFVNGYALLIAVWPNPCWLLGLVCFIHDFRIGHFVASIPGILVISYFSTLGLLWYPTVFTIGCGWFWAASLILMFLAGLLNFLTRPRLTRVDDDE